MDEGEAEQFQEMINAEQIRAGLSQVSRILKAGIDQLVTEGWTPEEARAIVLTAFTSSSRVPKPPEA